MKNEARGPGSYVRKVGEGLRRYTHELLGENERLRLLVVSLEGEKLLLEEKTRQAGELCREHETYRGLIQALEREKLRLQEQLLAVHEELDRHLKEQARMQRLLGEVEKENRRFSEQFVEVEQQNTNLANLYVASYRLHATLDRTEVLEGIQEITANLIGCEELAILEVTEDGRSLSLLASYGIDPAAFRSVPLGAGIVGHTALTGETYLAQGTDERVPQEADLTACLPLKLSGRVTGVLALFRLLPQKRGFEAVDYELFDLLATHAATALYCTGLHARLSAETLGRR